MAQSHRCSQWLQYFYFIRFSLILWIAIPLLCGLDFTGVTATITRGIFALDSDLQAFWAAFFIVAFNMSVLVTLRNTVRNGNQRFSSVAPESLYRVLTSPVPATVWKVFAFVHGSTLLVLGYLGGISAYEGEQFKLFGYASEWFSIIFLAAGVAASLLFWYLVSLFYYWIYRPSEADAPSPEDAGPQPAALIFPRTTWLFDQAAAAPPPPRIVAAIRRTTIFLLRRIDPAGYSFTSEGPLWELHLLSAVSLLGITLVYLFLYPLTAPVTRSTPAVFGQIGFCLLVTAAFLWAIRNSEPHPDQSPNATSGIAPQSMAKLAQWLFSTLAVVVAGMFIAALSYDWSNHTVRLAFAFPTFASILVLTIFFVWLFSGAAFFLDRFRVPVLATVVLCIFLPKIVAPHAARVLENVHLYWLARTLDSDHYFNVQPVPKPVILNNRDTPPILENRVPQAADAFDQRIHNPDEPYIVVTASGGGSRAADFTAQIMATLEFEFYKRFGPDYTFHDHILLLSGVSGGSVGLMPYLLEYTADGGPSASFTSNQSQLFNRITASLACSGLEAVGWGLTYHDFYRLVTPFRIPGPLAHDDAAPDRSWALAAALNRNLHDEHCNTESTSFPDLPHIEDGEHTTLLDSARRLLDHGGMPAFTFNTTTAETGSRFLLSNYYVPSDLNPASDFVVSESFLQAYAAEQVCCNAHDQNFDRADLPLATAARLSATFPIVSSGTRIPQAYAGQAYHFLDGGYYDNDGTSSAIEFLVSGMQNAKVKPKKILLIEIRDDDGLSVSTNADTGKTQNDKAKPWTPLSQLTGIAGGLWNAGHESISRRNRRELCLLERNYPSLGATNHLSLMHVVFTIPEDIGDRLSPLSWRLTTGQLKTVKGRVIAPETQHEVDVAVNWVNDSRGAISPPEDLTCQAR